MGEFDLSLIREFRSRPAFYDRNDSRFKDKIYTAHEWQEISYKLGYDVSLLKDRMLQLRNRYNLEKRRLEQLREENPGKHFESAWPLFDQLCFLSEHIRARRSYKRMQPRLDAMGNAMELSNSGSNPSSLSGNPVSATAAAASVNAANVMPAAACQPTAPFVNGLLTVKMEEEDSDDDEEPQHNTDAESGSQSGNEPTEFTHTAAQLQHHANILGLTSKSSVAASPASANLPPAITIRRLDTMRDNAATLTSPKRVPKRTYADAKVNQADKVQLQQQQQQQRKQHQTAHSFVPIQQASYVTPAKRVLSAREEKFVAFGDFMSASLLELPPARALQLVEKFTSEVVSVLLQKGETALAANVTLNGDLNGQ